MIINDQNKSYNLDEIDKKIIGYLQENARMPFLEVAKKCGISGAAVHQRVRKLEETGVLHGSSFNINPRALNYDFCAFVGVYLNSAQIYPKVVAHLKEIPEIVEGYFLTGHYSLLLKIYCKDNAHLMKILINTIQNIPGVERTETFISLDQPIMRKIPI